MIEAKNAEQLSSMASSWKQLFSLYEQYAHCDDGAIAEGFSESTTLLLANQWQNIEDVNSTLKLNPKFNDFIIQHIDETIPLSRLKHIRKNVNSKCPLGLERFCNSIQHKINQILILESNSTFKKYEHKDSLR